MPEKAETSKKKKKKIVGQTGAEMISSILISLIIQSNLFLQFLLHFESFIGYREH